MNNKFNPQAGVLMPPLKEVIAAARKESHHADGKCSMCAAGDEPKNGLHRGQYRCGNNESCVLCHNAGMEYDDQCAACGRVEKQKIHEL